MTLLVTIIFETSNPMWAVSKTASQGAVPAHCDHITIIILEMRLQHDLQANVFEAARLKEDTSLLVHLITTESGQNCSYCTWFVEGLKVSYQAGGKLEFSLTLWQSVPLAPDSSQRCAHLTQRSSIASPGAQLEQRGPLRNILKDQGPVGCTGGARGTQKIAEDVQRRK